MQVPLSNTSDNNNIHTTNSNYVSASVSVVLEEAGRSSNLGFAADAPDLGGDTNDGGRDREEDDEYTKMLIRHELEAKMEDFKTSIEKSLHA